MEALNFEHEKYGTILRTPDDRFNNLPGYSFNPNYIQFRGLRIHYVDEGKDNSKVCLCLHGEPSWSYLYRRMIPIFVKAGYRVIAPDFIGFGKSDKIVNDNMYGFDLHRDTIMYLNLLVIHYHRWLIEKLDLKNITLVCQDWGGCIGLTIPMDMPNRFNQLLIMNTGLLTGDLKLGEGLKQWRAYNKSQHDLAVGKLIKRGTPHLTDGEVSAYDAPYPDARYKAGVRIFPMLLCESLDSEGAQISRRARDWWSKEWAGKAFMAIGVKDPVLGVKPMIFMQKLIKNCNEPMMIENGGHFVQEWGEEIAVRAVAYFGSKL